MANEMSFESAAAIGFARALATHILKWLTNLNRAKGERQLESLRAVNKVVSLIRKTTAYSRGLRLGQKDFRSEAELAEDWSDLAHKLDELGLTVLAKKCDLSGRYWADSNQFTPDFLSEADIGFQTMEKVARKLATQIRAGSKSAPI
jgi:hypothetical protein